MHKNTTSQQRMQSKFKLRKSRVKEWKSLGFFLGGGILCSKMEMLNFKLF